MYNYLDIKIEPNEVLSLLSGVKPSGKGEYQCNCPFCGKQNHFYIGVSHEHYPWSCKKCQEEGNIFKLLKHLGVLSEYIHKSINLNELVVLNNDAQETDEEFNIEEPIKPLPRGFVRIYNHKYLNDRGFTSTDYYRYIVGVSTKSNKLKDYIVFVANEYGVCRGWVGRSTKSKKECERLNILRYRNSSQTNFSNILYGFDEITKKTTTVIIVEGIFDKIKIDRVLELYNIENIKCVCSFGNKVSKSQLLKLKCTNVERVILFYDLDAIDEMKKNAPRIEKHFELDIACLDDGKDPDESSCEDIIYALGNLHKLKKFFHTKCNGRKLKT